MCGSPPLQGKVRDGGLSLASAAETIATAFSWPGNNRVKPSMLGCKVGKGQRNIFEGSKFRN